MTTKSRTTRTKTTRSAPTKTQAKRPAVKGPRTRKNATAKPTATRRKAPAAAKVAPTLVTVKEAMVSQPDLRKKELIDLAVERSGLKKKDIKPAVEAILSVLGEALADGREWNLRPMGKLKVQRQEEKANGTVMVCRIRQPRGTSIQGTDPAIKAAE